MIPADLSLLKPRVGNGKAVALTRRAEYFSVSTRFPTEENGSWIGRGSCSRGQDTIPFPLDFLRRNLPRSAAVQEDRAVFQHEAVKHLTALYNFALSLAKDEGNAADLVQETYLRALRFRHRFQPGTNLRAWMFKILRNAFIDSYWRRSREPAMEEAESEQGSATLVEREGVEGVGSESIDRLVRMDLHEALEQVPDQFRTAILLSDVEGLSVEEIAEIMDCPPNTVKTRLFRGRRLLRGHLKDYGN